MIYIDIWLLSEGYKNYTAMHSLMTGICSEKCINRQFIVMQTSECTYTNLDGIVSTIIDCAILLYNWKHRFVYTSISRNT